MRFGEPKYFSTYRNIAFRWEDQILEVRLHTDGGPLLWGADIGSIHTQLGQAFRDIAFDSDNKAVIFTGTGDAFCDGRNGAEYTQPANFENWHRIMREANDMLLGLLNIDVPVISAVNGPALIHSELAVLADIVIAADTAVFQDTHMNNGVVPGDGCHAVWNLLLGRSRGHYFLLMAETMSAQSAHQFGVVHEILPPAKLSERAWEIARQLAAKNVETLRYTRMLFSQPLKESLLREMGHGTSLLGLSAIGTQARSQG
jgi:enoyl-CoA hydratase/carnithine racemase